MGIDPLTRAVFLDRDGVVNRNVLNPATGQWENPLKLEDFRLHDGVIDACLKLQTAGYRLFIVTNQPAFAKGKMTLEATNDIAELCLKTLRDGGVRIDGYYACLHHPEGIVPGFNCTCACRKPGNFFLQEARRSFGIDLPSSWMVGDRDTDIQCGKSGGTKTIFIRPDHPGDKPSAVTADFIADSLAKAADIILSQDK